MPQRYDAGGTLGEVQRTSTGGIVVPAALTRVGVFAYRQSDGSVRRELRCPEEVYAADSLASLADVPVTEDHPPELVTPSNVRRYARGHARTDAHPEHATGLVTGTLVIQDADTIARIDSGALRETSLGYSMDLDPTPGTYRGQAYDAVQRNIRYNHVALGPVGWGRAGREVALRLDAGDAVMLDDLAAVKERAGVITVKKIKIPKIEVDAKARTIRVDGGEKLALKTKADRAKALAALGEQSKALRESLRVDAIEAQTLQDLAGALDAFVQQFMTFVDAAMSDAESQEVIPVAPSNEPTAPEVPVVDAGQTTQPATPIPPPDQRMMGGDSSAEIQRRIEVLDHARAIAPRETFAAGDKPRDVMAKALKALGVNHREDANDDYLSGVFFAQRAASSTPAADARRVLERSDSRQDPNAAPDIEAVRRASREAIGSAWRRKN